MSENNEKLDKSVSLTTANIVTMVLAIPLLAIFVPLFIFIWDTERLSAGTDAMTTYPLIAISLFIGGIVVHELLHGITWQALSGKWDAVKYGFKWTALAPYAHMKARISAGQYRVGVWMPGMVVGVLPLVISLIIGNGAMFWFGMLFTWAAGGDAIIWWLLRDVPNDAEVEDHPSRAGCYVYL
ncbi:MAG: DUF3267 domain-containing protein [Chloroflexota bacterium]